MQSLSCPTRTMFRSAMIAVPMGIISSLGEIVAISNGIEAQEVIAKTAIVTSIVSLIAGFVFSSISFIREKENIDQCMDSPDPDLEKNDKEGKTSSSLKNKITMCVGESISTGAMTALIATAISSLFGYSYSNS